jgi:hypothetical protein
MTSTASAPAAATAGSYTFCTAKLRKPDWSSAKQPVVRGVVRLVLAGDVSCTCACSRWRATT